MDNTKDESVTGWQRHDIEMTKRKQDMADIKKITEDEKARLSIPESMSLEEGKRMLKNNKKGAAFDASKIPEGQYPVAGWKKEAYGFDTKKLKYIVINIDQCYKNGTMDTVELQKEINLIADQGYRLVKSDTMFFMVFELIDPGTQITGVTHPKLPWKRKP